MKSHLKKFNEIQNLLQLKLGAKVKVEEENGSTFLSIKDSNLWLSVDHSEFTVGFGLNHTHFSEEYGNLQNGIRQVFDLLTSEVRVTKYIKGETVYKAITEIKTSDSNIENLGITGILIYPFWKKTRIETSHFERIIDRDDLIPEIDLILR